jgi:hypothetical protein
LTFDSPLGVSIKYPSSWRVVGIFGDDGVAEPTGTHVVIDNGVTELGKMPGATPGVMRASIRSYPEPFDATLFSGICELPSGVEPRDPFDGPADKPVHLTIEGREAVLCEASDLTQARLESYGFTLWVEMPNGQVVEVSASGVVPMGDDLAIARAIVDSFSLTAAP